MIPIIDFPGYHIDEDGVVWSDKTKRYLKPAINGHGYKYVSLWKNNKQHVKTIHVLVAINFLEHVQTGTTKTVVDHIDGDKLNNNYKNLQLISNRENITKNKRNRTSIYPGVSFKKGNGKWSSRIFKDGKSKHLGYF